MRWRDSWLAFVGALGWTALAHQMPDGLFARFVVAAVAVALTVYGCWLGGLRLRMRVRPVLYLALYLKSGELYR